jgi:putative nucleotidyltransferase with HDIG domain
MIRSIQTSPMTRPDSRGHTASRLFSEAHGRIAARTAAFRADQAAHSWQCLHRLRRRLRSAHDDTVMGLLAALQAKDPYTHSHSLRVCGYTESLARTLRLSGAETGSLRLAALFHDIGKIATPDAILAKPGALDARECRVMKRHSAQGADILRAISFLAPQVAMVLHHHEWFDGTGYPARLAGEDIPFGARVIHVADSVDAMISPRGYRPSLSLAEVFDELEAGRGTQFDPDVAAAAIEQLGLEGA